MLPGEYQFFSHEAIAVCVCVVRSPTELSSCSLLPPDVSVGNFKILLECVTIKNSKINFVTNCISKNSKLVPIVNPKGQLGHWTYFKSVGVANLSFMKYLIVRDFLGPGAWMTNIPVKRK